MAQTLHAAEWQTFKVMLTFKAQKRTAPVGQSFCSRPLCGTQINFMSTLDENAGQVQRIAIVPQARPTKLPFCGDPTIKLKWAGRARPFQGFA